MPFMTEDSRGVPDAACPRCQHRVNRVSELVEDDPERRPSRPKPGDVTLCIRCGAVLRFTLDLGLAELPQRGLDALPAEQRRMIRQAQQAIRQIPWPH